MPSKRELRDFPPVYFELAEHFLTSREPIIMDSHLREATSVRQDFYRFVHRIRRGAEEGDSFCQRILPALDDLEASIKPARGDEFTPVKLRFLKNALKSGIALRKAFTNEPIGPQRKSPANDETGQDEDLIDLTGIDDLMAERLRDPD